MPTRINPTMIASGYAPAKQVAQVLHKSVPTIHRMVRSGDAEGVIEGGVLYVRVDSLEKHYADNAPMLAAVARLKSPSPSRKAARS